MAHGCAMYSVIIPKEPRVALVERGQCYFSDKIPVTTKLHNATTVIVYNNQEEELDLMMRSGIVYPVVVNVVDLQSFRVQVWEGRYRTRSQRDRVRTESKIERGREKDMGGERERERERESCLLYTSDAADE